MRICEEFCEFVKDIFVRNILVKDIFVRNSFVRNSFVKDIVRICLWGTSTVFVKNTSGQRSLQQRIGDHPQGRRKLF